MKVVIIDGLGFSELILVMIYLCNLFEYIVVCAVEIVGFEKKDKIDKLPRKYLNINCKYNQIYSNYKFTWFWLRF